MPRPRSHTFNRTFPYQLPVILGIETLGIYRRLEHWVTSIGNFLSSLYLVTLIPYWLCLLLMRLQPINSNSCSCCLKKATNYARRGPSLDEVRKAACLGCNQCAILAAGVSAFFDAHPNKFDGNQCKDVIEDLHFKPEHQTVVLGWRKTKGQLFAERTEIRFHHRQNDNPSTFLPDLLVDGDVADRSDSQDCMNRILSWTENCTRSHEQCRGDATDLFLPSRLIDVHNLRLVQRQHIATTTVPKYVALSHCWGDKAEITQPIPNTTAKNFEARQKSIEWTDLTKSFQDAVVITRRIGLDYLWIDSLCIIQGNADDWVEQSAQMGEIYREAFLVISATRARNGDIGIFHKREGGAQFSDSKGRAITVRQNLRHENFFVAHKPKFDNNPVFSRGWCYQERLLARRVVHFTDDEAIWECNQKLNCECQGIKVEAEDKTEGNGIRKEFKAKFSTLVSSSTEEERDQCWMHIIEGYSARLLTFESDRLPALSGIAQRIDRSSKGRYLAGMWETELPNSLLWYPPMMPRSMREAVVRVPGVPSWAWPSIGVGITPHYEKHWHLETVASVLDVSCMSATSDVFGKVDGGRLSLLAPIVKALFQEDSDGICLLINPDNSNDSCRVFPDSYSDQYLPVENSIVYCVGVELDLRPGHASGFKCVIVREARNPNDFLRISQTNCPTTWAKRAQLRSIRII